jgi:hypothetical protein
MLLPIWDTIWTERRLTYCSLATRSRSTLYLKKTQCLMAIIMKSFFLFFSREKKIREGCGWCTNWRVNQKGETLSWFEIFFLGKPYQSVASTVESYFKMSRHSMGLSHRTAIINYNSRVTLDYALWQLWYLQCVKAGSQYRVWVPV